ALCDELGRHVGVVIDTDVIACEHLRQRAAFESLSVHHDRRIVRPMDPRKHGVELVIAIDKDGSHERSEIGLSGRLAGVKYDMAKRHGMKSWSRECRDVFRIKSSSSRAAAAASAVALRQPSRAKAPAVCWLPPRPRTLPTPRRRSR